MDRHHSRVDIALKGLSLASLLVFGYLITRYGWDNHYFLVILVALFWRGLVFLPVNYRVNVTLLSLSVSATLFLVNVVLAVKWEIDKSYPRSHWRMTQTEPAHITRIAVAAKHQGHAFDTRTRVDVLLDLRAKGVDAWPSLASVQLYNDFPHGRESPLVELGGTPALPLGGISNKTVVYCNENGSYIFLENDEYGFSNPKGLWSLPRIDVAAIGDSFTHGACVPQDDSFVAVLRKRYPASLNLGNDANGPFAELATLREYLPQVRPKIVLWVYCEKNDLDDLGREMRSPLVKYLDPQYSQGLSRRQAQIDQALMKITNDILAMGNSGSLLASLLQGLVDGNIYVRELEHILKFSHVWHLMTDPRRYLTPVVDFETETDSSVHTMEVFQRILKMGKDTVQAWGGEMLFVYLPEWERYSGERPASPHREVVLDLVTKLGIPVIDIHAIFGEHPDPLRLFPFRQPAHYNAEGYQLVAGAVDSMIANRLAPTAASRSLQ